MRQYTQFNSTACEVLRYARPVFAAFVQNIIKHLFCEHCMLYYVLNGKKTSQLLSTFRSELGAWFVRNLVKFDNDSDIIFMFKM